MPRVDIKTVMAWQPCSDYTEDDVLGLFAVRDTIDERDILALDIPTEDKLWVLSRNHFVDEKILRLTTCRAARRALALVKNHDPRSIAAMEVAERYAVGNATDEDLIAARVVAEAALAEVPAAAARAYVAATSAVLEALEAPEAVVMVAAWASEAAVWSVEWDAEAEVTEAAVVDTVIARVEVGIPFTQFAEARAMAYQHTLTDLCELSEWEISAEAT